MEALITTNQSVMRHGVVDELVFACSKLCVGVTSDLRREPSEGFRSGLAVISTFPSIFISLEFFSGVFFAYSLPGRGVFGSAGYLLIGMTATHLIATEE